MDIEFKDVEFKVKGEVDDEEAVREYVRHICDKVNKYEHVRHNRDKVNKYMNM